MSETRNIAILLFDDAEVLDFCGPFEVFSVASNQSEQPLFDVMTVAQEKLVNARNGLSVVPSHSLDNCPKPDILLVPGGIGTRRVLDNSRLIGWIRQVAENAELVLSVCTGALLLGKAGLLDGLETTTHHAAYGLLREIVPSCIVHEDRRFVDNGRVVTSAGISAGIDMSLHIVERLAGSDIAKATSRRMEYGWKCRQPRDKLLDELLQREHQVWQAVVDKNSERLANLFTDDYVEITLEGQRVCKADIVGESPKIDEIKSCSIDSEEVRELGSDVVLLNYHLTLDGTCRGVPIAPRDRWVTSIWNRHEASWRCSFFSAKCLRASRRDCNGSHVTIVVSHCSDVGRSCVGSR